MNIICKKTQVSEQQIKFRVRGIKVKVDRHSVVHSSSLFNEWTNVVDINQPL